MKTLTLSLIAAAMTLGMPAIANEAHHPDQGKPAAVQPGANTSTSARGASQDATSMMEMMDAMHRQMEQLRDTSDPNEREKLLRQHMQAMRDMMVAMHGMGGAKSSGGMTSQQDMHEQ